MSSARLKHRRVVHKSTAGILKPILGCGPVGNRHQTQSLRSTNESLRTCGHVPSGGSRAPLTSESAKVLQGEDFCRFRLLKQNMRGSWRWNPFRRHLRDCRRI